MRVAQLLPEHVSRGRVEVGADVHGGRRLREARDEADEHLLHEVVGCVPVARQPHAAAPQLGSMRFVESLERACPDGRGGREHCSAWRHVSPSRPGAEPRASTHCSVMVAKVSCSYSLHRENAAMDALRTTRLLLRPLRADDAAALSGYRSDPEVARYQSWEAPFSRAQADRLIGRARTHRDGTPDAWRQWALERVEDGRLVGDLGVRVYDDGRQAEVGFTIAAEWQRQGYALEGAVVHPRLPVRHAGGAARQGRLRHAEPRVCRAARAPRLPSRGGAGRLDLVEGRVERRLPLRAARARVARRPQHPCCDRRGRNALASTRSSRPASGASCRPPAPCCVHRA